MNALSNSGLPADNRPLAGVLWMILTGLLFVAMTAVVKHMGDAVPPAQTAFLRYLLGLIFLAPMLPAMLAARPDRRGWALFGLRGAVHTIAVILWFYAMTQITLAEVTALNYLTPIYVAIGAVLFLGERLRARRMLAIGAAVIGALIMLRPGFRELSPGHLAMLVVAVFMGLSYLLTKLFTGHYSPPMIVGMLSITVTIGLAPFAWAVWVPVTGTQLAWLFLIAFFATTGHYTMTLAFAAAPVSVTQPVTALQLVWAVILGAIMFGEAVDLFVVLGGAVIVAAVIFIALREQAVRRAEARVNTAAGRAAHDPRDGG